MPEAGKTHDILDIFIWNNIIIENDIKFPISVITELQ